MSSEYAKQDLDALIAQHRPYGDDQAAQFVVPFTVASAFVRDRALDPSDPRERGFISVFGPLADNGDPEVNPQPRINIEPSKDNPKMASAVDHDIQTKIETQSFALIPPGGKPLAYKITKGLRIPYVYVSNERLVEANIFILYSGSGEL
jgi:hypothetical protein